MDIEFGKKFTQIDLDKFVERFWENAKNTGPKEIIVFNMQEIEWIALEEITFLFGWFRYLLGMGKKIFIKLPPLDNKATKRTQRLINLWNRWEIGKFVPYDPKINGYRYDDYFNISTNINPIRERFIQSELFKFEQFDNNNIKILPFIEINVPEQSIFGIDTDTILSQNIYNKFNFDVQIENFLNYYSSNTIFENKALSHIITNELYFNVIHHSFPNDFESKKQCYSAINLKGKFDVEIERQKENRRRALFYAEEHSVSFDIALKYVLKTNPCSLQEAENKVDWIVKKVLPEGYLSELDPATLPFFEEKDPKKLEHYKFRNESYIEYTFLDFGLGIANTLRDQFLFNMSSTENEIIKDEFNKNSIDQNIDTQILEYAFLLSTSRLPFKVSLENNNLIPRGLYFLIDIVKRYRGMVVARSGKGKIIYDFSNENFEIKNSVRYSDKDNSLPYFQGTLISITLPAKTKNEIKQGAAKPSYKIPLKIESKKPLYYSFREIFSKISETPKPYTKLFEEINSILDKNYKKNCLIIFDFLAFNVSNIDHKILFFLCTSPKINEVTSVVITNFKNLVLLYDTQIFIQEKISYAGSFNLIAKPIPVINSTADIFWIGVANQEDEKKLNELLNYKDYQVPLSDLKNKESNLGHLLLADKYGNVISLLPTISLIYEYSLFRGNDFRQIFLTDKESNKQAKPDQIYLTAGGYFQKEYISLFEKLNDKEISKPLAEVFINTLLFNLNDVKYDKIVSVTLSSQLIAKAIYGSFKEQDYLSFNRMTKRPNLVRLASYYSFDDEIEFKTIKQGDKVLVVNDVISTGNLIKRINDAIKRLNIDPEKEPAEIVGVLTVVDTRKTLITETEKIDEVTSIDFNQVSGLSENKIIKLFDYPIIKFKDNPIVDLPEIEIIRINPILNSEISLDSKSSEEYRVAFKNQDILKEIPPEYLYIGHFSHNHVHHTYFFNTTKFFQSENGSKVGSQLLKKVYDIVRQKDKESIPELSLLSIRSKINILKDYKNVISKKSIESLDNIEEITKDILREIWLPKEEEFSIKFKNDKLIDTFILYPFFSGIEEIQKPELARIFDISQERIIDLQRFDTNKGWRFIPVPKTLDREIEGKSIIVLDDGSCTGDTIIQIIDSLCFVRVKNITVISIIGRLEDFNREFFSRIKELKVKSKTLYFRNILGNSILNDLGEKEIDYEATQNEKLQRNSPIIPVNIYFGSNFHIPVYASTKVCSFCKEIDLLLKYEINHPAPPNLAIEYIKKRLKRIEIIHTFELDEICPFYFPKIRYPINKNERFDLRMFYRIRDEIGKIDGFRFFKDYYFFFNEIGKSQLKKNYLEAIIAVCVHEIRLIDTIKNQLPDVYLQLKKYISNIIINNSINETVYTWDHTISSLTLFYLYICSEELFSNKLVNFVNFIKDDNDSCCLFVFFIWEQHLKYRNKVSHDFPIYNFRDVFYSLLRTEIQDKENREPLYDDIIEIFKEFEYTSHSNVDYSFYKIKQYFQKEKKTNSKFPGLSRYYYTAHPSFFNRISPLLSELDGLKSRLEDEEEITFIPGEWKLKWKEVYFLLKSLLIKHYEALSPCILKFDIFFEYNKYFSLESDLFLSNLCKLISDKIEIPEWHINIEIINDILIALNNIIEEYIKPTCNLFSFFDDFLNFNPYESWEYIISVKQFTSIKSKMDSIPTNIELKDEVINAHPIIIQALLFELFQNALTHPDILSDSNNTKISIEFSKDNKFYIIKFRQNKEVDSARFYAKKETGIYYYCNYLSKHFGFKYQPLFRQTEFELVFTIPLLKKYDYE